jgi:hypothetical protein
MMLWLFINAALAVFVAVYAAARFSPQKDSVTAQLGLPRQIGDAVVVRRHRRV